MLKLVRITAIAEGISYLAFALTMPLKYMWEIAWPNKIVGMAHGVLFVAFCLLVVIAAATGGGRQGRMIVPACRRR